MNNDFDVAIVGMAGQFPGAKNIQEYWDNLVHEKETIKHLTSEELDKLGIASESYNAHNYVPASGGIEDIDLFAAEFFGYSPKDAALIDPQQRKLLELAWHALEDAAINPAIFDGNIGVFAGSSLNTYLLNNILSHPNIDQSDDIQQILFSNGQDYLASRIAYLLNLKGAAINIQTACSTSLVAIHEACQYLTSYQVDAALAGGVSIAVPNHKGYLYSVDGILSPDGHCRPFSNQAEGTVFSSGLGLVVLKRLADAIEDQDAIYAVIKSSAVNNDGRQKVGYTAPSVDGQAEVIALAQGLAGVAPEQIGYIEAHGTATALGDPIEVSALQKVFAQSEKLEFCALGSVKSNMGHLDVAAGVAGFIKVALSLKHKKIPGTLYSETLSNKVNWKESPFFVNSHSIDWVSQETRYAGVSSFGIGGTNAHAILAEIDEQPSPPLSQPALLVFSAKSEKELEKIIDNIKKYCLDNPNIDVHSIARTLQQGRVEFNYRAAFICTSISDCIEKISNKNYLSRVVSSEMDIINPLDIQAVDEKELESLREKWLQGYKVNWYAHYEENKPRKLHLPVYPFTQDRYWIDPYSNKDSTKKLNMDDWFYLPSWKKSLLAKDDLFLVKENILLILSSETQINKLLKPLDSTFSKIIWVKIGDSFNRVGDNQFILNCANPEHYKMLIMQLKQDSLLPTHFLHTATMTSEWVQTSNDIFMQHQEYGLLSALYFIQAWDQIAVEKPLKLTVLTNRLNSISAEYKVEPHKSPILAAVKVIPKEFTKVQAQLIDIDALDFPQFSDKQVGCLQNEILKDSYDLEEIVFRGAQRWIRCYEPTRITSVRKKPAAINAEKVILVTGGLGQLGLDIADYFSLTGSCKIAILARSVLPKEEDWPSIIENYAGDHPTRIVLERIQAIKNRNTCVKIYSADVGDKFSLQAAICQIEKDMGSITGVVHAAGETINGIISLKSVDSLNESYQAKVMGTYHLYDLLKCHALDFMILCSSMNAIIGGLGQLDNTAANSFIDYMAEYIVSHSDIPAFSINWGAVNVTRPTKVNVLHQFMDLSTEHKKNRMTDDEINEVYDRLLTYIPSARVVISTIDMKVVLESWNRVASVAELTKERAAYSQHATRQLDESEALKTEMQLWLGDCWKKILGINEIGLNDNFFELGGHSLAAVQIITKIKDKFGIKMHVMNLYELPTLVDFSDYLDKQKAQKKHKQVV